MKANYVEIRKIPEHSNDKIYVPTYVCDCCGFELKRLEGLSTEKLWHRIGGLIMLEIFDTPECEFCKNPAGGGKLKILEFDDKKGHRKSLNQMMALTDQVPRCNENILIDGKWEY